VQFTETLKGAGIYNGNAGVITGIDRETGRIKATLDAAAIGGNGVTGGTLGDVLQARIQTDGSHGGYGNDVLDGGAGGDGVTFTETGGFLGTYTGNSGDNFFPEGVRQSVRVPSDVNDLLASVASALARAHAHVDVV